MGPMAEIAERSTIAGAGSGRPQSLRPRHGRGDHGAENDGADQGAGCGPLEFSLAVAAVPLTEGQAPLPLAAATRVNATDYEECPACP